MFTHSKTWTRYYSLFLKSLYGSDSRNFLVLPKVLLLKAEKLITRYEMEMANEGWYRNTMKWILNIMWAVVFITLIVVMLFQRPPYIWPAVVLILAVPTFGPLFKAALDQTEAARRRKEDVIESKRDGAVAIRELGRSCGALQEPLSELVGDFNSAINSMLNEEGKETVLEVISNTKGKVEDIREKLQKMYVSAQVAAKYVHALKDLDEILHPLPKDSIRVRFKKLFCW